jgi:disulfide bond formation protein DsbB
MAQTSSFSATDPRTWSGPQTVMGLGVASALTLLVAFGFEYLGGYVPCPLCLQQRWAYWGGALGAAAAWYLLQQPGLARWAGMLLALIALGFACNSLLGVYHAGIEWTWWAGPTTCSGGATLSTSSTDLLNSLETIKVQRCDEAQFRFAGLSFAGWNVLISAGLAALAVAGYRRLARS